jgi:nitroreductase
MDLFDALKNRRACRAFLKEPVADAAIGQLLNAAARAPTASNRPYRHCVLVDDPNIIRALRMVSPSLLADPPLLLIIVTDLAVATERTGRVGEVAALVDAGAAGENVLLAATALGLGSQFTMISAQAGIRVILGLPEHVRVDVIIPLGLPDGPVRSVKPPAGANPVHHNQFGRPYDGHAAQG